jgi:hypothetical protein
MRKLLLASAAILGATSGLALAQDAAQSQGQFIGKYGAGPAANNFQNSRGSLQDVSGTPSAGALTTIYGKADATPTPGTIVIRLNGRVEAGMAAAWSTADRSQTNDGVKTSFKVNPVGAYSYLRLYPGFDGLAANGLRYGASAEIRENFESGILSTALGGSATTGSLTSPSGNTSAQTLMVRRSFTYLAHDNMGVVRIGVTDGVVGLFDNCVFSSQCWDAGHGVFQAAAQAFAPVNASSGGGLSYPWLAQAGTEYGNNKIVYLTPQFFGFDFGVQYAPNMGNSLSTSSQTDPNRPTACAQAGQGCIGVSSGDNPNRWLNQVGIGGRYQGSFGAVDVKAYGFYETAGKEQLTTAAYTTTTATTYKTANVNTLRYDNLSFYQAGFAVTTMNVTAAVSYIGGRYNGQLSMAPTGGAAEDAVVYGLTYANGPIAAGIDLGIINDQGNAALTKISQRHQVEIGFGGSYRLAPGVQLFGEYQYVTRHQGGLNMNTGGFTTAGNSIDAKAQAIVFGTALTW